MPLEAGALILDAVGWGKPLWLACGAAVQLLLDLAHRVASARGAVALLPSMPGWSFAGMVAGGLWLCLWTTRLRLVGLVPIAIGAMGAALTQPPDLLVTGDGKHLAVVRDGTPSILRDRAGDYVRGLLSEASGFEGDPELLEGQGTSDCSRDACVATLHRDDRQWTLLATRSATRIDWETITRACASVDIAVSDRRLPRGCQPRWLKLDRTSLERTGGVAISLGAEPRVDAVADHVGAHPWAATRR
jgi:competence protein ComEC